MELKRRRIVTVAGARPNFMKIAPIQRELAKRSDCFATRLVHTGQHYDAGLSQVFFDELEIDPPDVTLDVGSRSHAQQTAAIMAGFESVLLDWPADLVIVVGDVNSTLACALVAVKMGVAVAHVEAGLRSFDRSMPEEINRVLTDHDGRVSLHDRKVSPREPASGRGTSRARPLRRQRDDRYAAGASRACAQRSRHQRGMV